MAATTKSLLPKASSKTKTAQTNPFVSKQSTKIPSAGETKYGKFQWNGGKLYYGQQQNGTKFCTRKFSSRTFFKK